MRLFSRADAEEILTPCGVNKYLDYRVTGLWPAVARDLTLLTETELLRWRPARELQEGPDTPVVADTPMLPFPFTANDLAAFLLEGIGALVADFYGDWNQSPEPDPQMLALIDPDTGGRKALIEAYAAYQAARLVVPAGSDGLPDVSAMVHHLIGNGQETSNSPPANHSKPLQRSAAQDAAILGAIRAMGYDPTCLPANIAGKAGLKAAIHKSLANDRLFAGTTIFKKAWERLTEREDIVIDRRVSP